VTLRGELHQKQLDETHAVLMELSEDSLLKPFRQMARPPSPGVDLGGWYHYDHGRSRRAGLTTITIGAWTCLLSTTSIYDIKTAARCRVERYPAYCSPNDFEGTSNILYHNNGEAPSPTFPSPRTSRRMWARAWGVAFADYGCDGLTDIFVSNDTISNVLLHNNGDG
jgi:hypothetical protein